MSVSHRQLYAFLDSHHEHRMSSYDPQHYRVEIEEIDDGERTVTSILY
mgnify:CR=1 FL=1